MKLLSIAIPCYNSEAYMRNCIHSLLVGGEEVEIIIVDDGSVDGTAAIADEYAEKYPTIIKAIHQENSGHGGAVNTGICNATGLYFKVVDSDDWVSISAYKEILKTLGELAGARPMVDMLISNFVYEKEGAKHKKVMSYRSAFPKNKIFTWDDVKFLLKGQYILMHSIIYRTKLLRECGMELPQHTFYVDNIFAYYPLPYVKYLYYLDENFYRYYIGREDQSVNEKVMISRLDQQLKVNRLMIDAYKLSDNRQIPSRKLRHYMKNDLEIIMVVSSILAIRSGTKENLEKKYELWRYLKKKDPRIYYELKWGILGRTMNLPGRSGRKISEMAYKLAQRFIGFN
ncbi:MAG: glycosyltransferase family 2 protein [Lachnospiraceae bacterium]|nr:glycosyltransferase family 2 protein [Lachnospiraceae bacterium]